MLILKNSGTTCLKLLTLSTVWRQATTSQSYISVPNCIIRLPSMPRSWCAFLLLLPARRGGLFSQP
ncbi:hypothetical protein RSAG8_02646, partial [Rhizoctonia solani AG-8 WAC10335]